MKKKASVIVLLSLILMVIIIYSQRHEQITTKVHEVENGFGYSIIYKKRILIKQDFIPEIPDKRTFCSKKDAQLIAGVVRKRLEKNIAPSITLQDLKDNNIQFNCN